MDKNLEKPLFFTQPLIPENGTCINGSLWYFDNDGFRVVFFRNDPIYRVPLNDVALIRFVAVTLRQSGRVTQAEIAKAFGHSVGTQIRWEHLFQEHGISGLQDKRHPGRPSRIDHSQDHFIRRWFLEGLSNVEIARRLCVNEATVRRALKRLGLVRNPGSRQPGFPEFEKAIPEIENPSPIPPDPKINNTSDSSGEINSRLGDTEYSETDFSPSPMVFSAEVENADTQEQECHGALLLNTLQGQEEDNSLPSSLDVPPPVENKKEESAKRYLTFDRDPTNRCCDRFLAKMGWLQDAVPLFGNRDFLPMAGVFLAIPVLVFSNIVGVFHKVFDDKKPFGPSFYGLRNIVLTLIVCALLRIKRPENLKEYQPKDLGALIGLDRFPEVKTLRLKLRHLANCQAGTELINELAENRLSENEDRAAFFYLDGHVREYFGKEPIFETKKAQRQVASPASTDTWVHDSKGEPLLVVTSEINAGLTQVMDPIIDEIRPMLPPGKRLTVIFDRGGFNTKLFHKLRKDNIDIITYRKGKTAPIPISRFSCQAEDIDGKTFEYNLCDRPRVRVGKQKMEGKKNLRMREIRVLRKDGRQTTILTTIKAEELSAVQICVRMFGRWRQENFFKYMKEEYALDALLEYGANEVDKEIQRRNPAYLKITRLLRDARADVAKIKSELGEKVVQDQKANEISPKDTEGSNEKSDFKTKNRESFEKLEKAEAKVVRLKKRRKKIPKRIPATGMKALKREVKLIGDAIKMTAYQIETHLLGLLKKYYSRNDDEGRTLLNAAFHSIGSLEVKEGELHVTIGEQSSNHRTRAIAQLCEELNGMGSVFPGTDLKIILAVEAKNL